jgi:hypothetical protein
MIMSNRPHIPTVQPTMVSDTEAHKLAEHLTRAMGSLLTVLNQETELVRAGKVREAMAFEEQKSELSRNYTTAVTVLKANQPYMKAHTPDLLAKLQQSHEEFRGKLQINLTVLATAHAVSEGIIRGVNGEMQKRSMPSTYNASGNRSAPGPRHVTPLAVSRSL